MTTNTSPWVAKLGAPLPTFEQCAAWVPEYSKWRHGGWYVTNVRYPGGATGCVSNNYADRKWRIVCGEIHVPFPSRDAAARAEYAITLQLYEVLRKPFQTLE